MKTILSDISCKMKGVFQRIRKIPKLISEMSALLKECNYNPYYIGATRELWRGVDGYEPPRYCEYHKRPVKECREKHCNCRLTYFPPICACGVVLEEQGDRCRCSDEQDFLDWYGEDEEDKHNSDDYEDPDEDPLPRFDGKCPKCRTLPEEVPYEGGYTIWMCACDR